MKKFFKKIAWTLKRVFGKKIKHVMLIDGQELRGQFGYAVNKQNERGAPKGHLKSDKELKAFVNRNERSLLDWAFLINKSTKDLAMYYIFKKFGLDVEKAEFDGFWYKIPVPDDNNMVPPVMLFTDRRTGGKFLSFAILRDER